MQRCWLLTELFYPEETSTSYLLTKIANRLAEKYEMKVICGPEVYEKEKASLQTDPGFVLDSRINVKRVKAITIDKNSGALLLGLRSLWISFRIAFYLFCHVKKGDKVLMVTTPVFLLLFVAFSRCFKSFIWNILVYDVFPENARAAGLGGKGLHLFYTPVRKIFERAYAGADTLIVLGRDMKEVMARKIRRFKCATRIEVIENWAEIELVRSLNRKEAGLDIHKVNIQYAGNLGRVQGLIELLEVIKEVDNPLLSFAFIGSGALKERMEDYVSSHQLSGKVCFAASYKRSEQEAVLNRCDLALITLSPGMYGLAVPSKSYNIMAAGRPILYIGPSGSEIWQTIEENKIGFCFEPADRTGIIRFLNKIELKSLPELQAMGRKARILAEECYAEEFVLKKYLSVL